MLTDEQINFLVKAGSWKIECDYHDDFDAVVYEGGGVPDIDRLLSRFEVPNRITMRCDVGFSYDNYTFITVDDLRRLRAAFIAFWGDVPKPNYWDSTNNGAANAV